MNDAKQNSSILLDSVGKTFAMPIWVWLLENEKKSGEYKYNTLYFHSDNELDWDSFREIKEAAPAEKPKNLPKPENKKNKHSNSQQENQNDSERNLEKSFDKLISPDATNDKGIANSTKILVGVGIILAILGLIMFFWVYQKKNAKGKL